MATQSKIIGRVPVSRQEYIKGMTCFKDNIVTCYGSAFQCIVDSTTTPPATLNSDNEIVLGKGWIFFADASDARRADKRAFALVRDFGQYAELPSVAMTAETIGKYINADGEFVDDADFNIAAIGAVVVGNTYELYMSSADKMKLGVALFVARIKTTTTSGTERIEYVPLFSAMSTDIPTSGYVCFEAMEAYSDVLVCYRADVPEAATLRVRRYGTKASIATQINNLKKKVDLKSFADGYYESMRVGTADNLASKGEATEEVIMSRKAGGDNQIEDGSASIKRIKGYSMVMNQVLSLSKADYTTTYGLTVHAEGDVISIAGQLPSQKPEDIDVNVYLSLKKDIKLNSVGEKFLVSLKGKNFKLVAFGAVPNATDFAMIVQVTDLSKSLSLAIRPDKFGIAVNENVNARVINLTQIFGSGNEPSTPDDFAKRLGYSSIDDVPYIPYNEGEIVSSFVEGVKTSSRNLMKGLPDMGTFGAYLGFRLQPQKTYCLSLKKRNPSAATPKGSIGLVWNYDGTPNAIWAIDDGVETHLSVVYDASKNNIEGRKLILGFYPQSICQKFLDTYDIQLEYGTQPTDYVQPQSWVRNWKNTINKYFKDGLLSVRNIYDEITPTKAVKKIVKVTFTGDVSEGWTKRPNSDCSYSCMSGKYGISIIDDHKVIYNWNVPSLSPGQIGQINGIYVSYTASLIVSYLEATSLDKFRSILKTKPLECCFVLDSPEEITYDELNLTEQVTEGGTEEAIITDGKTSTPLRADIVYPIDAYNTIKANKTNIGTLSSLNTASKTDLVSAINELAGKVGVLEAKTTEESNKIIE